MSKKNKTIVIQKQIITQRKEFTNTFYHKNKIVFLLSICMIMISGFVSIATNYIIQNILDATIEGGSVTILIPILKQATMLIMILFLSSLILRQTKNIFLRNAILQYKKKVFDMITKKNISSFSSEKTGSYLSVLTNDATAIYTNYLQGIFDIIQLLFLLLGALSMMLWYSPLLTLIVLVMNALPLLVMIIFGNEMAIAEKEVSLKNEGFLCMVKDML